MSLKTKLLEALEKNGRLDLNELDSLCRQYPAKISTAEKRLREFREPLHKNYHPEIDIELKDGYINAYVWKQPSEIKKIPVLTKLGSNEPYLNNI